MALNTPSISPPTKPGKSVVLMKSENWSPAAAVATLA